MNLVCLIGRLTKDPELKTTQNGKSVVTFSLAVDGFKDTDFIDCVAWNATAENLAKFKKKGEQIALTGRITTRSYEDRNGNKRKAVEIVADKVSFVGGKSNGETTKSPYNARQSEIDDLKYDRDFDRAMESGTDYVSVSENKSPLDDFSELPF